MNRIFALIVLAALASGCQQQSAEIDQAKLCIFSTAAESSACTPGELAWFRPDSWGSDQLPMSATAFFCDLNHQVTMNGSGVICVFTDKRLGLLD